MGVRLPPEYQEVTHIIGNGTQYIDTEYILTSGCRVQGEFWLYNNVPSADVLALFGSRDSWYNHAFAMFNVSAHPRADYGKTLESHSFNYKLDNNKYAVSFDINAGVARVNEVSYAFSDAAKPFTCPSSALIFAVHTGGTVDTRCPAGEITYFKITDENGVLVRNMIPCYRKSDNKPGMYDLVSGAFFVNQGTGEFIVGGDVIDSISPWLVARRRVLMKQIWPIEQWTYILFADSSGRIPKTKIPVYAGQHVHAEWDTASVSRNIGDDTIFSFYTQQSQPFTTGSPWYMTPMRGNNGYPILWNQQGSKIAFTSGAVDFEIPADLTMYVSCWTESEYAGTTERGLYGSYLKIRIT